MQSSRVRACSEVFCVQVLVPTRANKIKLERRSFLSEGTLEPCCGVSEKTLEPTCHEHSGDNPREVLISCRGFGNFGNSYWK